MRPWYVLLLATAVTLSGCTGGDDAGGPSTSPPPDDGPRPLPASLAVLAGVPAPAFDPATIVAWHADFVTTFIKRDSQTPNNLRAAEHIRAGLESLGYAAEIRTYLPPQDPLPLPTDPTPGLGVRVVIGVKEGREPDHVVGWVSHYDTETATIQGAYDNGSGTAMGFELARLFADHDNNKTLMAIFFDAEEIGLVASNAFVRDAVGNDEVRFDMVVGHDMVGINWPGHEWKMYQFLAECYADRMHPIEDAMYYEWLGWPATGVSVQDEAPRNSDERRFKAAGVPVIRMAGGLNASDYPQYHLPDDTLDYIHGFVGGEENWAAGLDTVVRASYWNIAYWDRAATLEPADPTCYA